MDVKEHNKASQPVQYLDTHSLPDVSSPPSLKTNLEVKSSVESSDKSAQKYLKKQQNPNVANQQQTAQSKLTKKNQKQLVGENFERMNYLYQCATRLACLTTPSRNSLNSPASHGTPTYLRKRAQVHQQGPGKETNSALIPPVYEDNTVIISKNDVTLGEVASQNRPSSDSGGSTDNKCLSPSPVTSLSTRSDSDNVPNIGRISSSSDVFSSKCAISNPSEVCFDSDQVALCSDNPSTSNPTLLCLDYVPSIIVSPSSYPDLASNTSQTLTYHDIDSTINTSQSDSGIDNIIKPLPSCAEMHCSSTNLTVPCSEMECTTNLTTPCFELDCHSHPTEPYSKEDCHINPVPSCRELASNVSSTCRAVGRKCLLRLSHHMKRELCRGCSIPLVPALTATAKIIKVRKKRVLTVRCLTCGVRRTRPCSDMKTLWADRCPPTV